MDLNGVITHFPTGCNLNMVEKKYVSQQKKLYPKNTSEFTKQIRYSTGPEKR